MARRGRPAAPGLDGVLVVAKPAGPTSHDVVALVRRLSATRRVGHGGTLDPFASGVLPVFLGRATRLVEYHLADRKRYHATVCFGAASTTDDLEGELTPSEGPPPDREAVEASLASFLGDIEQQPPAYSAVKVAGRRAYALARAGSAVELAPRTVTIHTVELVGWDPSDPARPVAVLDVECSAGTYVRALARDLGRALGNAAYLGALVRTASGEFRLDDAIDLEELRSLATGSRDGLASRLLPVDAGLERLPELSLEPAQVAAVVRGQFVRIAAPPPGVDPTTPVRVRDAAGRLVAIGALRDGRLAPDKVLADLPAMRPGLARVDAQAPTVEVHGSHQVSVVPGVDALAASDGPLFAAVGVFDGIHRGHRYLLDQLRLHGARLHGRPAVITFDSHPDEVLVGKAPPLLLDPVDRLRLIGEAGVEVVVVQHFDAELRATPYDEFVRRITSRTTLAGLLMTPDAAFGHERRGTPDALRELGEQIGFQVVVVPPFTIDGRAISSSEIRRLVAAGSLGEATRLLGRPYEVVADRFVVDSPGRTRLSFTLPVALPPPGEHSVRVPDQTGGTSLAAVVEPDGSIVIAVSLDAHPQAPVRVVFASP